MLEANYRTWCAQNDVVIDDGPSESTDTIEEEEWDGFMDVDEDELPAILKEQQASKSTRKKKGKLYELVREKVRSVLEDITELADRRARMCDEHDFLKLLWAFNSEGIHFS